MTSSDDIIRRSPRGCWRAHSSGDRAVVAAKCHSENGKGKCSSEFTVLRRFVDSNVSSISARRCRWPNEYKLAAILSPEESINPSLARSPLICFKDFAATRSLFVASLKLRHALRRCGLVPVFRFLFLLFLLSICPSERDKSAVLFDDFHSRSHFRAISPAPIKRNGTSKAEIARRRLESSFL